MKYKLFIFAPDEEEVINNIIEAASRAGAGIIGNYSQCAFITKGFGNWKSEPRADPSVGKVGEVTRFPEVKIEMECPADKVAAVSKAVKRVHPYEEVAIDFFEIHTF